jgi:hypothetical protein
VFVRQEDVSAGTDLASWNTMMAQFEMWSAHSAILYPSGSGTASGSPACHDLSSPAWPSTKTPSPPHPLPESKPDASTARPRSGP